MNSFFDYPFITTIARASVNSSPLPAITRDESSTWQKVARIPNEVFEDYLVTGKENLWELSTAGLLWYARQQAMAEPGEAPPLPDGVFRVIYADLRCCAARATLRAP